MYLETDNTLSNGSTIEGMDKHWHLWSIDDVKDGDVLYMYNGSSECIFIYRSTDHGLIYKYASYNKFGFEGDNYLILNGNHILPATREQCDLLFTKMNEVGYEWDTNKKEFRRIQCKSIDNVELKFKVGD